MSWERIKNHIAIREGKRIAHLEAYDIYSAMQDGDFIFNGAKQGNIYNAFPKLIFSPISKEARIDLRCEEDIFLSVTVNGNEVDFAGEILLDQIIVDDNWYYITNVEEIKKILSVIGVISNGKITISQYLRLVRQGFDDNIINNKVNASDLKKSLQYNKPIGIVAELYPYQKDGFAWIDYMLDVIHGCILGDEMGLGKTLQAIALIQKRKNYGKKCLVIAPVSLLDNWINECKKFAPKLMVLLHHGNKRTGSPQKISNYDVVVTSYGHAITDSLLLCMIDWELIILDEAQNIKNPRSSRAKSIKTIPSHARLAITGTPFENHVTDIWSLTDFVLPGYLGTESSFLSFISDDIDGAEKLEPILSAIMVRRIVKDVADELPPKVIIPQPISMTEAEVLAYEQTRKELIGGDVSPLPAIQKLRMYCTHPAVYDDTVSGDPVQYSLKYKRCCEILAEIFERKEKVLIFTSYQKMFDIFINDLSKRFDVDIDWINGSTPVEERQRKVDVFNATKNSALLILNPRAAGTGLNITSANHVIHYNLEWNPAVEDQASARAYRRGQTKTTFIYRLYYLRTVEEVVNERIERKREMADKAIVGSDGDAADMQELIEAIQISPWEDKNDY